MIFNNPNGTIVSIQSGNGAYLDKNGYMHDSDEIKDLFDYSDSELSNMGIEITFFPDELTDFIACGCSLEKYKNWLKTN